MTSLHAADPILFPDMGMCPLHNVAHPTPQTGRCLKLAGNPGWLCQGWMPGQEVGTHHLPPFLFPTEERLSWFVWFLYTCREITDHFAGCWNSGSSLHGVGLQPGWPGMGLSSTEPLRFLDTCWPVNSGLLPPRKLFRPNPGHFSTVFLTSVQPSTSLLGSSAQICPFLPNPTPGLLILHLSPASGWSRIHIRDNQVWWTCSIGDRQQRRAGTYQASDEVILPINRPSKSHTWWHNYLSGSQCWGGTQRRWLQPSKSIAIPELSSTPVPPLRGQAQSHTATEGWKASPRAISAFLRAGSLKWTQRLGSLFSTLS